MTLANKIYEKISKDPRPFTLEEINFFFSSEKNTTIRGRIYDNLGKYFFRVGKGLYMAITEETKALVVNGDGRNLSEISDESVDAIITDHPWSDPKSLIGGSRKFIDYEVFKYTLEDFKEKYRILKEGCFLIENLPEENENNWEYIYDVKRFAKEAGFKYYAQVPWKKGSLINNTGRKSKNCEYLVFFSKGKPRNLRFDKQRSKGKNVKMMSGTKTMLPTEFNFGVSRKDKKHAAEKPVDLYKALLEQVTVENELVLDQFAGSLNLVLACLEMKRHVIAYEIDEDNISKALNSMDIKFKKLN